MDPRYQDDLVGDLLHLGLGGREGGAGLLEVPAVQEQRDVLVERFIAGGIERRVVERANLGPAGIPYPIWNYAAMVPWTYFAFGLAQSSNSLLGSSALLKKIYFPRLVVPIASTLSGLVEMYHELLRRGELPDSPDITFVT